MWCNKCFSVNDVTFYVKETACMYRYFHKENSSLLQALNCKTAKSSGTVGKRTTLQGMHEEIQSCMYNFLGQAVIEFQSLLPLPHGIHTHFLASLSESITSHFPIG